MGLSSILSNCPSSICPHGKSDGRMSYLHSKGTDKLGLVRFN
jgi:hypothetical protein